MNSFQGNASASESKRVVIIGKPNSGKSLLFNRLTGLSQTVANFPGVTVEVTSGQSAGITYLDFPGVYSLNPITKDEQVAVERLQMALQQSDVKGIVCILDGTRLERSLLLGLQVIKLAREWDKSVIFAVNMMDEILANGTQIQCETLQKELGVPVLPLSAKTLLGMSALKRTVGEMCRNPSAFLPSGKHEEEDLRVKAAELNRRLGPRTDVILKNQNRLDSFFLSTFGGGIIFIVIMVFLFQAIFTWSAPMMDLVEETITAIGGWVSSLVPAGVFADFLNEAIFGGVGSFLVFVPQIFVLTFVIGLLEDSGYLVRAAIICHRPLSLFGLSGRSFVPLLSGHACAIPAIFATRTIESPRRRLLTIIALPLMACSARLPVYSLLVTTLIPPVTFLGGVIGLQGLSFFALYAFGIITALLVVGLLSKTAYRETSDAPFVLELPPYRLPSFRPLIKKSVSYATAFVMKAGGMIFAVTVVVWVLGYFPNGSGHLAESWLAGIGRWIEPIFSPLGLDWKFGVAILASFLAREVFVGTLGTLYGIEAAEEHMADLGAQIQASGLTLASGVALLVFYAIALQCVSTLAVIRKETGNLRLPLLMFVGYSALAYFAAYFTYLIAQAF